MAGRKTPWAQKCGRRKTNGDPCPNWAIRGGTVCQAHGGSAPQVRVKAAGRMAETEVVAQLARLDVTPVVDPLTALSELAGQAMAWRDALAERVNKLSDIRYEGNHSGEQLRAEVALWERALDRCGQFLGLMARLNIDERLARIHEQQSAAVVHAVELMCRDLGMDDRRAVEAKLAISRHLRAAS